MRNEIMRVARHLRLRPHLFTHPETKQQYASVRAPYGEVFCAYLPQRTDGSLHDDESVICLLFHALGLASPDSQSIVHAEFSRGDLLEASEILKFYRKKALATLGSAALADIEAVAIPLAQSCRKSKAQRRQELNELGLTAANIDKLLAAA